MGLSELVSQFAKKNKTVTEVDSLLQAIATERQSINDRKAALVDVIALAYGTPDAENAESEHSRLDARLKALVVKESNLYSERKAAEVREALKGYKKHADTYRKTFDELTAIEQGENGLIAVEARYFQLKQESLAKRASLITQAANLVDSVGQLPAEAHDGANAIRHELDDMMGVLSTHTEAAKMKAIYSPAKEG